MYVVYILKSAKTGRFYIGHSKNLSIRLQQHNSGTNKSTATGIPWSVVFTKSFETKSMAQHIELKIKRMKSRAFIEKLINGEIDDSFYT